MEEAISRLAVCWWDKPPLPKRKNVYRVVGDVKFADSKAMFKIEQTGSTAYIDVDQLDRIFVVETVHPAK